MPLLKNNIKIIRQHLNCTQTAFAQVLEIGFRTYVRYESGERNVPAGVLVKISRLGNISLDRLLMTRLTSDDLRNPDTLLPPDKPKTLQVISGSIKEGRLMLKGFREDFLITINSQEKSFLNQFRKLPAKEGEKYLQELEKQARKISKNSARSTPQTGSTFKKKSNKTRLKKMARTIKNTP